MTPINHLTGGFLYSNLGSLDLGMSSLLAGWSKLASVGPRSQRKIWTTAEVVATGNVFGEVQIGFLQVGVQVCACRQAS